MLSRLPAADAAQAVVVVFTAVKLSGGAISKQADRLIPLVTPREPGALRSSPSAWSSGVA